MTTYTLHLRHDARPGDPTALDEAEVVKDGFSWGAFLFTFLWFFFHRLWLAGILVLAAVLAFGAVLRLLDVNPAAGAAAELLLQILIGLEANSLRRWTCERNGRPAVDAVVASDLDEAEAKAFARWLQQRPPAPARAPASPPYRPLTGAEPVIGLFPDAEVSR